MNRRAAIAASAAIALAIGAGAWWQTRTKVAGPRVPTISPNEPAAPAASPDVAAVAEAPAPLNAAESPPSQRSVDERPADSVVRSDGQPLSVLVTDPSERPIAAASVRLYPTTLRGPVDPHGFDPAHFRLDEAHATEVTGADGRATWPHGVAAGCFVAVEAKGYATGWGTVTAEELKGGVSHFPLSPAGSVLALLVDGATGRPVPGATVIAWKPLSDESIASGSESLTFRALAAQRGVGGRDGRVEIPSLPLDTPSELRIEAEGYPPRRCQPIWPLAFDQVVRLFHGQPFGGRVVDREGVGIPGVRVQAVVAGVLPAPEVGKGHTGDDGSFQFDAIPPAPILIQVSKQGFALGCELVDPRVMTAFEIALLPEAPLTGITVDDRGELLPHANLVFEDLDLRANVGSFETYDDASFAMPWIHPDHSYAIEASAAGHTPLRLSAIRPTTGLRIVLARRGAIRCRVVDGSGAPIVGFKAAALPERLRRGEEDYQIEALAWRDGTAADGTLTLRDVDAGPALLRVHAKGYVRSAPKRVVVPPGDVSEQVEITLERAASIAGRVVTPDRRPVVGATVSWLLDNAGGEPSGRTTPTTATTDGAGAFTIDGMPPHPFALRVTDNVHPNANYPELRAEEFPRDLVYVPTARIDGRILTHWSAPESAIQLDATLDGMKTYSSIEIAADGTFRFGPAPAGRWLLIAHDYWSERDAGAWRANRRFVVDVAAGETAHMTLDLTGSGRVLGHVQVAADGPPAAEYEALLLARDEADAPREVVASAAIDVDGSFSMFAIPAGRYVAQVVCSRRGHCGVACAEVSVTAAAPTARVELALPPPSLQGVVVDGDDHPLLAEVVILRARDGMRVGHGTTDELGRYALAVDRTEPVQLLVRARGFADLRSDTIDLTAKALDDEPLQHVLEPEARLEVAVRDGRDRPLVGIALRLLDRDAADALHWSGVTGSDGRVVVARLPAGRYVVEPQRAGAQSPARTLVPLDWGETRAVVLRCVDYGSVALRLVDPLGAPLADRIVTLTTATAPLEQHRATTASDGIAKFAHLAAGRWLASAEATPLGEVEVAPERVTEATLTLEAMGDGSDR